MAIAQFIEQERLCCPFFHFGLEVEPHSGSLWLRLLVDGRTLFAPLAWFPRLVHGTATERNHYELRGEEDVIHWPALDEDIDLEGLLVGGRNDEGADSLQRWLGRRAAVVG